MASADATWEMKRAQKPAKTRSPKAPRADNPKGKPGDWAAHLLSHAETTLAVGPDMQTVAAKLREQGIDLACVAMYQIPFADEDFVGGGELQFCIGRE